MFWHEMKSITHQKLGAFLALMIIAFLPNYGIEKYGPSPAVPAFLLCLLGGWLIWKDRLALWAGIAQRRWLWVYLLIFLPAALSVPASYSPRVSLATTFGLFLYYFSGIALVRSLENEDSRKWVIKWVSIVLLLWVVDSVIQLVFGIDPLGIEYQRGERLFGPFRGNLRMSTALVILLPIFLAWMMPRNRYIAVAAFGFFVVLALLSGARTVMVFVIILSAGLFLRLPGHRPKMLLAAGAVLVMLGAVLLSPVLQERVARLESLRTPTFEKLDEILSGRMTLWDTSVNMVADRPLLGVGVGAFRAAYDRYSTIPGDVFIQPGSRVFHAHQLYISAVVETGIVGLLAMVVVVGLCVAWYLRARKENREWAWPFAMGLLVYAFPFNSQLPLFTQWLFPVLVLLMAGMLAALGGSPTRSGRI